MEEAELLKKIIPRDLPSHVAIIMDGNGRWAKGRGLSRIEGHRAGVKPIRMVLEVASEVGIKFITLFAFSTENKNRPKREINALTILLETFLKRERKNLIKNNIRLMTIGDIDWFPESVVAEIRKTVSQTSDLHSADKGLTLVLALNYGGRDDIVHACRGICADLERHKIGTSDIDENTFSRYLYTEAIPDPDLLIRTSNEYRISNFLLWQLSYTELWITPVLWPDFSRKDFLEAIISYQNRLRRFGLAENA